jgi:hypothetical protein
MAIERERGISLSSVVMSFEHEGLTLNLLDKLVTRISAGILPHVDCGSTAR